MCSKDRQNPVQAKDKARFMVASFSVIDGI
jgi:hypothetical protein